jgi:hypothetical protein
MSFTTLGPKLMGDLATVFFRDAEGHTIPVLDIIQGEGKAVDAESAKRLAENIVSALNGKEPQAAMNMPGIRVNWSRLSRGFKINFQQEPDLGKKMVTLALFNDACPPAMVGDVSDRLAERQGIGRVLNRVSMIGAAGHRFTNDPRPVVS